MTSEESQKRICESDWKMIVRNVPIPSVDLVVRMDGGLLLGKRQNEPAKGEWFVPGGRLYKNERLTEAAHRIANEELGTSVTIDERLGTHEHRYETAEVDAVDGKHYIATGFAVTPEDENIKPDEQHSEFKIAEPPFRHLHQYVLSYLDDLNDPDEYFSGR